MSANHLLGGAKWRARQLLWAAMALCLASPAVAADAPMPAWRQGMAVGEWRQIEGTAMSSAPMAVKTHPALGSTGPKSKVIAWNGFALDTRDASLYSAASGGHMDYAGNEVNRLRLADDAPAWTEPRAATPAKEVVHSAAYYVDGRPTSRHSYYGTWVDEARDRIMLLAGSRFGDGNSPGTLDGFDLRKGDWDKGGTHAVPGKRFEPLVGSAIVHDPAGGAVYVFSNWTVSRWRSGDNTWEQVAKNLKVYGQYAAAALDTKRRRILLVGGNGKDRSYFELASGKAVAVDLGGPRGAALMKGKNYGIVYDPSLDAFLVHTGEAGANVYRIDAQTFAVDLLPTRGGADLPPTRNGVWRRFLYVPSLQGVVYVPTYEGNVWFLRTN